MSAAFDPLLPQAFFVEDEASESGPPTSVATLLLTSRTCPWRCVMCDLWKNTIAGDVAPGAVPAQIRHALERLLPARRVKVYNSGSFFDYGAVPRQDYEAIARLVGGFETVVVESHPALVGRSSLEFRDLLGDARLEVAMGLETAHSSVLEKLNKGMTLDGFRRTAAFLSEKGIGLRVFLLVGLPFLSREKWAEWTWRSVTAAFDAGAGVVSLIPTRSGDGVMEALRARGDFEPPTIADLESALEDALAHGRGRVFADLWDLPRFSTCVSCLPARTERLRRMNLTQSPLAPIVCGTCGSGA